MYGIDMETVKDLSLYDIDIDMGRRPEGPIVVWHRHGRRWRTPSFYDIGTRRRRRTLPLYDIDIDMGRRWMTLSLYDIDMGGRWRTPSWYDIDMWRRRWTLSLYDIDIDMGRRVEDSYRCMP